MSDLRKRSITGIGIAIVTIAVILGGSIPFSIFICILGLLVNMEIYRMIVRKNISINAVLFSFFCTSPLIYSFLKHFDIINIDPTLLVMAIPIMILFLFGCYMYRSAEYTGRYVIAFGFGISYVSFSLISSILVGWPQDEYSILILLSVVFFIWSNDIFAYVFGRKFGKTPLAKTISPKKTWEGTISGIICTAFVGIIIWLINPVFPLIPWLGLSIILAISATFGDLLESSIKRYAGVKDSGTFLPGHGGAFDRYDSFICAMPVAALYIILFF